MAQRQQVRAQIAVVPRHGGDLLFYKEIDIMEDVFQQLACNDALSHVSTTYQRALKYGEEKIVVTVSCACDQNEATIDRAGELTFRKALELTDNNFGLLMEEAERQSKQNG
jgi:hypothetical protein